MLYNQIKTKQKFACRHKRYLKFDNNLRKLSYSSENYAKMPTCVLNWIAWVTVLFQIPRCRFSVFIIACTKYFPTGYFSKYLLRLFISNLFSEQYLLHHLILIRFPALLKKRQPRNRKQERMYIPIIWKSRCHWLDFSIEDRTCLRECLQQKVWLFKQRKPKIFYWPKLIRTWIK